MQSICLCLCVGKSFFRCFDRRLVGSFKLVITALVIYTSLMQTGYVTAVQTDDVSEFMLRLNFGLAMIKRHKVCAVEGYVVHNFHMTLPEVPEADPVINRCNATSSCDANIECSRMYAFGKSVAFMSKSMRQVVVNLLNKTEELIQTQILRKPSIEFECQKQQ
jgi:hypothetical protein